MFCEQDAERMIAQFFLPDEALHVEAEQVDERLLHLVVQPISQLLNVPLLHQVPQQRISRLSHLDKHHHIHLGIHRREGKGRRCLLGRRA